MASQNDTEPSDFVFETHTNHNVLPPSDDDEHGKPRIAPDILQFIVDQNEVDKQMLVVCFVLTYNGTCLLSLWKHCFEEPFYNRIQWMLHSL